MTYVMNDRVKFNRVMNPGKNYGGLTGELSTAFECWAQMKKMSSERALKNGLIENYQYYECVIRARDYSELKENFVLEFKGMNFAIHSIVPTENKRFLTIIAYSK